MVFEHLVVEILVLWLLYFKQSKVAMGYCMKDFIYVSCPNDIAEITHE